MKRIFAVAVLASLTSGTAFTAQPVETIQIAQNDDRNGRDRNDQYRFDQNDRGNNPSTQRSRPRYSRGDRFPREYMQEQYFVSNWRQHNLRQPPRGHRWVRDDNNDFFLVVIATGVLVQVVYQDDRYDRWRQRYARTYSRDDDIYYRECRNSPDPAGILAGALIGGLLGNAAGRGDDRAGTTIAGIVVGGALGAALTSNLDCDDRSYAYRTYYDGLNSGRTGRAYSWRNPANDHRGEFRIVRYENDRDGFRCANYTQTIYIGGRPQNASGRACQQPDGAWVIAN